MDLFNFAAVLLQTTIEPWSMGGWDRRDAGEENRRRSAPPYLPLSSVIAAVFCGMGFRASGVSICSVSGIKR